jgi:hypothetical protein
MITIEKIIEEIKHMDYQDLGRIQYELDCRVAWLDKYVDVDNYSEFININDEE